jgi:hypothetical protein
MIVGGKDGQYCSAYSDDVAGLRHRPTRGADAVLPSLTAEDLKDLGVGTVGHRRLRAVALGAVILCYLDASLVPSGYAAVDMFFVISRPRGDSTLLWRIVVFVIVKKPGNLPSQRGCV